MSERNRVFVKTWKNENNSRKETRKDERVSTYKFRVETKSRVDFGRK